MKPYFCQGCRIYAVDCEWKERCKNVTDALEAMRQKARGGKLKKIGIGWYNNDMWHKGQYGRT